MHFTNSKGRRITGAQAAFRAVVYAVGATAALFLLVGLTWGMLSL